jgi:hypothetical protein
MRSSELGYLSKKDLNMKTVSVKDPDAVPDDVKDFIRKKYPVFADVVEKGGVAVEVEPGKWGYADPDLVEEVEKGT